MHHWWQLATRNWSSSAGRSAAAVLSVALGVATVVIITSFYETARRAITQEVVHHWLGAAHLSIQPPGAHWGTLDIGAAGFSLRDLTELDNVRHVTARLRRRMVIYPPEQANQLIASEVWWVDAIGIDPETERHFRSFSRLAGRMIEPGERGVAVIEHKTARDLGIGLSDALLLATSRTGTTKSLTVVGLFDSQRLAEFQQPYVYLAIADVQELHGEPGAASAIDIMLEDTSRAALAAAKEAVERVVAAGDLPYGCRVESAEGRQMILNEAERITRLLLLLSAFVALLTSFFIILTTMSMSLFQRRSQLGILRCIGMTRAQLAGLLLLELAPLGVMGTLLGIALGMGVTHLAPRWAASADIQIYHGAWGMGLSAASGILTTLLSALILLVQVCGAQPLAAVHTEARPARSGYAIVCGALGIVLLVAHECFVGVEDQTRWLQPLFAMTGAGSLYMGYVLLAPMMVVLLGPPIARLVGPLLGVRPALAVDQFGRAPWRSTGVCWVLMVGLSLIVYLGIASEAFKDIWDFPGKVPEAFVWSRKYVPGDAVERVRSLPGVVSLTVATDVECTIETVGVDPVPVPDSLAAKFLRKLTRPVFVACQPERLLSTVKVAFMEGSAEEALPKLARGGYVLIPAQTAYYRGLHLGDHVSVRIKGKTARFEIAGVMQSPALDLAITAFGATSYMQVAASNTLIGTRADLLEEFGLDAVCMFMLDLDLPETPPPIEFEAPQPPDYTDDAQVARFLLRWASRLPNEKLLLKRIGPQLEAWLGGGGETSLPEDLRDQLRRYARCLSWVGWRWARRSAKENWERFRERLVLTNVARTMGRPEAIKGSLRRLKQAVDRSVQRATLVVTWIPSIALAVAAIGIGNLMMVSVHIRSRQIAVLRAVGAVKSQIIRLLLAEAVALGLLGSVMGVALGLHEAYSDIRVTAAMVGFHSEFIIPFTTVAVGVIVTVSVCLLAGLPPARYAARNNIIDAMQTT